MNYTLTLAKKQHILWLVKTEQISDMRITGYKDGDKSAYTMRQGNIIDVLESGTEVIEKVKDYPAETAARAWMLIRAIRNAGKSPAVVTMVSQTR